MLKKLCLFKIIILTLRHNSKVIAYQLIGFVKDENIEMVQFHQSYSYEDFVQGIRPSEEGGFERRNGIWGRTGSRGCISLAGRVFMPVLRGCCFRLAPGITIWRRRLLPGSNAWNWMRWRKGLRNGDRENGGAWRGGWVEKRGWRGTSDGIAWNGGERGEIGGEGKSGK